MDEFKEETQSIEVPKNVGVEGFIHTVRELLRRPRLQEIRIDARGKVVYRQYVRQGEQNNVSIEFGELAPSGVIRNTDLQEVPVRSGANAASVIGYMLDIASTDRMHPIAFVSGPGSLFGEWYCHSTGMQLRSSTHVFGLPLLLDRLIPDTALILCAGYGKDAAMIDTQRAYKVEMELVVGRPPDTTVEVM